MISYATKLSIKQCKERCTSLAINNLLKDIGNVVFDAKYRNNTLVITTKSSNFNKRGFYKNAYRNLVCKFYEQDQETIIDIKFKFRAIHVLICITIVLWFSFDIAKDIIRGIVTNNLNTRMIIPSLSVMLVFSLLNVSFLWINVWIHRDVEVKLQNLIFELFECVSIDK